MRIFAFNLQQNTLISGVLLAFGTSFCSVGLSDQSPNLKIDAAGWVQYSFIGNSSYHSGPSDSYDHKGVFTSGAQFTLANEISEKFRIAAGLGIVGGNTLPTSATGVSGGYALPSIDPYISAANFSYAFQNSTDTKLSLRAGLFDFDYNPDVKNLGLYLLRGPVYPGVLISGFETKSVLPVANFLGLQLHHEWHGFQQDFLLESETDYFPFFDLSPVYIASFQVHPTFRVGAGINFYHLIPVDSKLTKGTKADNLTQRWNFVDYSDTVGGKAPDTTNLSFNGIKLMVNATFDPKPMFASTGSFGDEDLKLYGEIALIGLKNGPAYRKVYGNLLHRMPMMVGLNLPTFKFLNHLSLEVEWYGAPFEDNLDHYNITGVEISPKPTNWDFTNNSLLQNERRDNWKWSLHGAKTIQNHIQISFQVANDHYRPGIYAGYGDSYPPLTHALLITPKDWYCSSKLSYFF